MHQTDQRELGLLILYQLPDSNVLFNTFNCARWDILSFLPEEDDAHFIEAMRANGIEVVKISRAAELIEASALETRRKYSTFMEEWPERFRSKNYNFKQLFTYGGELSYWWLTNASVKQNELSPTFDYLCHLEIVKTALEQGAEKCFFVGCNSTMAMLISRTCQSLGLSFWTTCDCSVPVKGWEIYGLFARTWLFFKLLGMLLLFRLFFSAPKNLGAKSVGFYTLFPSLLSITHGSAVDRNYRGLPALVEAETTGGALFLATFSPESWRDWRGLWKQRTEIRSQVSVNLVILESLLQVRDLMLVLSNIVFVFRYSWLQRHTSGFRRSFQYGGIDIFELLAPEFARAFLGNQLPTHLVLARLVERALKLQQIDQLVCFLELYPAARALYYGAQKSGMGVKTVAYQHASVSSMKLWYTYRPGEVVAQADGSGYFVTTMPIPDLYLFQGKNGLKVILESGYPQDRCSVTGSPRYDILGTLVSDRSNWIKKRTTVDEKAIKKVLVIPSLSDKDGLDLVKTTLEACSRTGTPSAILVKPHPSSTIGEQALNLQEKYGFPNFSVTHEDLYSLIQETDLVVTSYSTVGDEAIALGCPVICYTGLRPSMSTFVDIPAAPLVHDATELHTALERVFNDPAYLEQYQSEWPALVEGSFFRLDGKAEQRMLACLMELDKA